MGKRAMAEYRAKREYEAHVRALPKLPKDIVTGPDGRWRTADGFLIPDGEYRDGDGVVTYEGNFLASLAQ